MGVLMGLYLFVFTVLSTSFYPEMTVETLIIRATGSLSILMLHVILGIGPLARLDKRFLPLLYNRRHLGVTMFLVAFTHGTFSIIQFHALGNTNALLSLFTSNLRYNSLVHFPFQTLGFFALMILFLMAATSHDFWLNNLGPRFWKSLHMLVYIAYTLVIMHVMLGTVQFDHSPILVIALGTGMLSLILLHLIAGYKSRIVDRKRGEADTVGYVKVGEVSEIANNCAKTVSVDGERIAVFKYDGKLSAISDVCCHQNGPLGEGRVIDGCVTCPWHGYQYYPHNGQSPAPFKEKLATYDLKLVGTTIWVNPHPSPPGTHKEPIVFEQPPKTDNTDA